MPGAATNNQGNLPLIHLGRADHATINAGDVLPVRGHEAVQGIVGKFSGIVEYLSHDSFFSPMRWRWQGRISPGTLPVA